MASVAPELQQPSLIIGMMSGTSMDGVDAALLYTDGQAVARRRGFVSLPYDDEDRAAIVAAIDIAAACSEIAAHPQVGDATRRITLSHARAVASLLDQCALTPSAVDLIGFHGQTIMHRPASRQSAGGQPWTWQIGDAALLVQLTGIAVAHDFRSHDVAQGGEGAPLLPVYHSALVAAARAEGLLPVGPVAVLNIGGVANVTFLPADPAAPLLAFDTGPGNAPLDDWVRSQTSLPYDVDGQFAARGAVSADVLGGLLDNSWFDAPPPKSLDRTDFSAQSVRGLPLADGAATLAAFTVEAVRLAQMHLPDHPESWVVCGGGRHNPHIMQQLASRLGGPVINADTLGWNGDSIEAEGFAYMAARIARGLPISFPGTTGVPAPSIGGRITNPDPSRAGR